MSDNEFGKHDRTLLAMITQYQTLAMIGLGKIQNPATGEVERDLDQARIFIDILEMLKVKCRTDTPADLLRLLDSAVMDLQLNFLDESKKAAAGDEGAGEEPADAQEKEPAAGAAEDESPEGGPGS